MKELRPAGTSIRVRSIFDPRRRAILLLGGDKAGNWKTWCDKNIPIAERRYKNCSRPREVDDHGTQLG
jgi:hypothetical protein